MTRAVTFNGSTQLLNGSIGKSLPFAFPLGSGILSYWYRAVNQTGGVVFLAYANRPYNLQGHHVRLTHFNDGASRPYPILYVQNPTLPRNTANAIFAGGPLPADSDWHHMAFSWNVNVIPYEFVWAVSSAALSGSPWRRWM